MKQMFIGGRWVGAQDGRTLPVINPADGEAFDQIARGGAHEVDAAVKAARAAADGAWGKLTATERGRLLIKLGIKVLDHHEELAQLEARDTGKPITTARNDITVLARYFEFYGSAADKLHGEVIPFLNGHHVVLLREPLGVTGHIIPWNYPAQMMGRTIAPALAAGNAVVLKPAEDTSLSALRVAELAAEVGFPEGSINVVTGLGEEAGAALAGHPGIDFISFTGSNEVGTLVQQAAAKNAVKCVLELGGKSPHIVFDDVDVDRAVANAIFGIYTNCGQVCTSGSRIFVHEKIHDVFVEKLVARAKAIRIGNPLDPMTQLGPLVSKEQFDRVSRYVKIGQEEGARMLCGGGKPDAPELATGHYFSPTVFVDVDNRMKIAQEEIFGPVACVLRFSSEEDVLAKANDIVYGLAAGIQTNDIKRAHKLARRLKAGSVWINTYHRIETSCPFGGYKMSGYGRENGVGMVNYLTRTKSVAVDLNDYVMDLFA